MLKIKIKSSTISPAMARKQRRLAALAAPDFVTHRPSLAACQKVFRRFKNVKQVIVIANGGSRNTTLALYRSLAYLHKSKPFCFVSSGQPDYLAATQRHCPPRSTLIFVVSKSGTNINSLEPLLFFIQKGYRHVVVVTEDNGNPLAVIAKHYRFPIVNHPPISGRFSGRTTSTLAVAPFIGMDIAAFNRSTVAAYRRYQKSALTVAAHLATLHNHGYHELFTAAYSEYVAGFMPLLTQLIHESTGQQGKGFTIFGDAAPESHHHTNQRFFGGRRDVVGLFIAVQDIDGGRSKISIPRELRSIRYRGGQLGDINGLPYQAGLGADLAGTLHHAAAAKIPHVLITIDEWNDRTAGELLAFWQLTVYYLTLFLGLEPFEQPDVERAKIVSWRERLKYARR